MSKHPIQLTIVIILLTLIKILLIPSYKSTDFDVHRNWLAITHHLPLYQWYFNNIDNTTVHTLDYPPSFAYFEYFLSNNYITKYVVGKRNWVNENCLALLGDDDNQIIGYDCIVFQRITVILFDVVYYIGSLLICHCFIFDDDELVSQNTMMTTTTKNNKQKKHSKWSRSNIALVLLWSNSGLIILDHVHFQYNGMLLGILLASIGMMLRSIKVQRHKNADNNEFSTKTYDLIGAFLFVLLLTFKHMYLTLSPIYFFYLLRRFCFVEKATASPIINEQEDKKDRALSIKVIFSIQSLMLLGIVVLVTLIGPFLPFLFINHDLNNEEQLYFGPKQQLMQILSRLFPWQRGLCHDYWAGNVWAIYLTIEKVFKFILKKVSSSTTITTKLHPPYELPTITPTMTAVCLIIGLIPSMYCVWKIASSVTNIVQYQSKRIKTLQEGLLLCIVYSSLTSFMLSYHVHEKAIMTSIIPMTLLSLSKSKDDIEYKRLFLRLSTIGHFGLLPLLHESTELVMKVALFGSYLCLSLWLLNKTNTNGHLITKWDKIGLLFMCFIFLFAEVIHPLYFRPMHKLEFLPLMMTSLYCSAGLSYCWFCCGKLMWRKMNEAVKK